jgi:hypothetical protein
MKGSDNSLKSEFEKFDAATDRVLSVSHAELKRREAKWKKEHSRKRKAKKPATKQEPKQ